MTPYLTTWTERDLIELRGFIEQDAKPCTDCNVVRNCLGSSGGSEEYICPHCKNTNITHGHIASWTQQRHTCANSTKGENCRWSLPVANLAGMAKRKPKTLPKFLLDDEPERIIRAATRERDRLQLLLMLGMGLRVMDVCRLKIEELDFRRRSLTVRCGKNSVDAILPIPTHLAGPLRAWCGKRQSGYVFPGQGGNRQSPRTLQLLIKRLAVKAGIRRALEPRYARPHALRHTFVSRLLSAGVPIHAVRDLARHSNLSTTDRYAHATPELLRESIDTPYR